MSAMLGNGGRSSRERAEWLLARSPLQAACRAAGRQQLRVLAYHGVPDRSAFAAQLDWLARWTSPVSLDDVRSHLLEGAPLPPHPVLLTFDDGERSILEVGMPLLRDRGIPAVAFVVAGLIDTDEPFWWVEAQHLAARSSPGESPTQLLPRLKQLPDLERRRQIDQLRDEQDRNLATPQLTSKELLELERNGVAVSNHSLTHPCLDRCDDATLHHEIEESHRRLTTMLGHPPAAFAYPNGNVDDRVRRVVDGAGYEVAFAFDHRFVGRGPDPLRVSRVRASTDAGVDRLRILVSGLHSRLHAARGRK